MTKAEPGLIQTALADLATRDSNEREQARVALERLGAGAVAPLIEASSRADEPTRREIFKVLGTIADPAAAELFLEGLRDEDPDCRWLAAEGLIALGREGLAGVLRSLTDYPDTERELHGAHHVLSGLRYSGFADIVQPVLRAFLSDIPRMDLPKAAIQALPRLRAR